MPDACSLIACCCSCVVCCLLHVLCCVVGLLRVFSRWYLFVRFSLFRVLHGVCLLFVGWCGLSVVCCLLFWIYACCVFGDDCSVWLFAYSWCMISFFVFVVCSGVGRLLFVVCCLLCHVVLCWLSSFFCCLTFVACCSRFVAVFRFTIDACFAMLSLAVCCLLTTV